MLTSAQTKTTKIKRISLKGHKHYAQRLGNEDINKSLEALIVDTLYQTVSSFIHRISPITRILKR